MIDSLLDVLREEERAALALRRLYGQYGCGSYKMGKFEDYDLYANNKDFLASERIITFTDVNGKLMALKPDVTLSILRHVRDVPGAVQKVFYDENVYRASNRAFREIRQVGLECVGAVSETCLREVLTLAAESLQTISSSEWVLDVSHLGILSAVVDALKASPETRSAILKCVAEKNAHGLERVPGTSLLKEMAQLHGRPRDVLPELKRLLAGKGRTVQEALNQLERVIPADGLGDRVRIDFSVVNELSYYNGIVFRGFIRDIPIGVLSGGQYDFLARRMGHSGAVGFAVYLDLLGGAPSLPAEGRPEALNVALPKGRLGERVWGLFQRAGFDCPGILDKGRRLVFDAVGPAGALRVFWVKPSDVPIYVERGTADVGVAGKDILLEYKPDVYELLDLRTGLCHMAVAAPEGFREDTERTLRVATEFPNIAQDYYAKQGRDIDILPLRGSLELAPLLGLSDVIVDIVETGTTLKENHLRVLDTVEELSARLIVNKSSLKFKEGPMNAVVKGLSSVIERVE